MSARVPVYGNPHDTRMNGSPFSRQKKWPPATHGSSIASAPSATSARRNAANSSFVRFGPSSQNSCASFGSCCAVMRRCSATDSGLMSRPKNARAICSSCWRSGAPSSSTNISCGICRSHTPLHTARNSVSLSWKWL